MKAVTIREVQHNLTRVLQDVEAGEEVEILRRKTPVARLVPIPPPVDPVDGVDWGGHEVRMASLWQGKSLANLDSVLADLRGER